MYNIDVELDGLNEETYIPTDDEIKCWMIKIEAFKRIFPEQYNRLKIELEPEIKQKIIDAKNNLTSH